MKSFKVNLDIEDDRWLKAIPEVSDLTAQTATMVAQNRVSACIFLDHDADFSVNLCLSDDENVRYLNAEFRGIDSPTNVLSFANLDDECFEDELDQADEVELGDIIVAYDTMARQAEELDISFHDHFCHLWIHGLLHILGYDHQTKEEADEMEGLEAELLAKLGIDNPYWGEE